LLNIERVKSLIVKITISHGGRVMNLRDVLGGLVCISVLVSLGCCKGTEDPPWAVRAGGPFKDQGSGVATFEDHSCVVVGSFEDTITIGPGQPNETQFTSNGLADIFLARFDRDGTLIWAKQVGGTGEDMASTIAGFSNGSFVVSGSFEETATFGTGEANVTDLISEESADVFVARYNADGTLAWTTRANGPDFEACRGIAGFPDGSCVLTGFFNDRLTFGKGEDNEINLISQETADVFVARYNADGMLVWAKRAGGAATCTGNEIAAFADGSCVVAMRIEGTATIGSGEVNEIDLTSDGDADISVARYNADGTLAWAKRAGGLSGDTPWGIATFADGSCVVAGFMSDVATFGPGGVNETKLTTAGEFDVFVARFNANGTLAWARQAGGIMQDVARSIAAFSDGSCVVTGRIRDTATFGLGEFGETQLASEGEADIFLAYYKPNGEVLWAEQAGGVSLDQGEALASFNDGSFIVTGRFQDRATFHKGGEGETQLVSVGGQDIFVSRYRSGGN
jgi:hypothetical protein